MAFRHKDGIILVSNINWKNERRTGITEENLRTSYVMLSIPDDFPFLFCIHDYFFVFSSTYILIKIMVALVKGI